MFTFPRGQERSFQALTSHFDQFLVDESEKLTRECAELQEQLESLQGQIKKCKKLSGKAKASVLENQVKELQERRFVLLSKTTGASRSSLSIPEMVEQAKRELAKLEQQSLVIKEIAKVETGPLLKESDIKQFVSMIEKEIAIDAEPYQLLLDLWCETFPESPFFICDGFHIENGQKVQALLNTKGMTIEQTIDESRKTMERLDAQRVKEDTKSSLLEKLNYMLKRFRTSLREMMFDNHFLMIAVRRLSEESLRFDALSKLPTKLALLKDLKRITAGTIQSLDAAYQLICQAETVDASVIGSYLDLCKMRFLDESCEQKWRLTFFAYSKIPHPHEPLTLGDFEIQTLLPQLQKELSEKIFFSIVVFLWEHLNVELQAHYFDEMRVFLPFAFEKKDWPFVAVIFECPAWKELTVIDGEALNILAEYISHFLLFQHEKLSSAIANTYLHCLSLIPDEELRYLGKSLIEAEMSLFQFRFWELPELNRSQWLNLIQEHVWALCECNRFEKIYRLLPHNKCSELCVNV